MSQARGIIPPGLVRLAPTLLPLMLFIMAFVLPDHMFSREQSTTRIGLGPASWPNAMLLGLAFFAALWVLRDIWALGAEYRKPSLSMPVEDSHYHFGKAIVGLVMILAYGWMLPVIGFALDTALFITIWCLFAGLRKLTVVLPVALIGTIALLWLFMGLALMPLPRGVGGFGDFSIWLLRATGIY
ncbi:tripartite tricarboxylate transporter TctB family protein [Yoonia sp.]|uniref:tripartite tricarboxylate transporter TctB family protein n=1 Tax=Yoonia sp. TaxID=2212373 RepID=UPI0019E1AB45|nr:tripartite tricarboxylate transporter TctB family protein [Yoonia sp.]MBE0411998.1 tripartite tricarboxylate transporter TctB family protein [Yoonia sp.]